MSTRRFALKFGLAITPLIIVVAGCGGPDPSQPPPERSIVSKEAASVIDAAPARFHPLDAIPASAAAVLRVDDPAACVRDFRTLAAEMDQKLASQIPPLPPPITAAIDNPLLHADGDRNFWCAAWAEPSRPRFMLIVRTKEPEQFAASVTFALGPDVKSYELPDGWTAFAGPEAGKELRECLDGRTKAFATLLSPHSRRMLEEGRAAAYANAAMLNQKFPSLISRAKQKLIAGLVGDADLPFIDGLRPETFVAELRRLALVLFGVADDLRGVGFAFHFDKQAIDLSPWLEATAGSATACFLEQQPVTELKNLERLPAGQLAYLGQAGDALSWLRWAAKFSSDLFGRDAQTGDKLQSLLARYTQLPLDERVWAFDLGTPADGVAQWTSLLQTSDSERVRGFDHAFAQAVSKLDPPGVDQSVHISPAAEFFGRHPADVVTTRYEIDRDYDPYGLQDNAIRWTYGPGGMISRVIYLNDLVVRTTGGGRGNMQRALRTLRGKGISTSGHRPFVEIRRRLPLRAHLIIMGDFPGLVSRIMYLVADTAQFPLPFDVKKLEAIKAPRSYTGIAVSTSDGLVKLKVTVSLDQIRAGLTYGRLMDEVTNESKKQAKIEAKTLKATPPK